MCVTFLIFSGTIQNNFEAYYFPYIEKSDLRDLVVAFSFLFHKINLVTNNEELSIEDNNRSA